MFDVLVNGHKTNDYNNIWVANIPQIQSSSTERDRSIVPQRDGDLLSKYYRRTSAYIEVVFHCLNAHENQRIIKSVFCNQINEKLKNSNVMPTISIIDRVNNVDNYDSYFIIKNAVITDGITKDGNYGRVTITYEVEPFEYMIEDAIITETFTGQTEKTVSITNDGDLCMPIIQITNPYNSQFELTLGVANQPRATFVIQTEGMNFVCDTKLMTTIWNGLNKEIYFTSHNYDDLWVKNGTNNVYIKFKPTQYISGSEFTFTFNARRGFAT